MIDNFELIKNLFYFNKSDNMFFYCQIMTRNKDHKSDNIKQRIIKEYYINSIEQLDNLRNDIIILCETFEARAYINVSGKDLFTLNKLMLSTLADNNYLNNIINPIKFLRSTTCILTSKEPRWLVDIDDITIKDNIISKLIELYTKAYLGKSHNFTLSEYDDLINKCILAEIPTKNGSHLIVKPFNLRDFKELYPNVDVHKNAGTLLYYPESLNK